MIHRPNPSPPRRCKRNTAKSSNSHPPPHLIEGSYWCVPCTTRKQLTFLPIVVLPHGGRTIISRATRRMSQAQKNLVQGVRPRKRCLSRANPNRFWRSARHERVASAKKLIWLLWLCDQSPRPQNTLRTSTRQGRKTGLSPIHAVRVRRDEEQESQTVHIFDVPWSARGPIVPSRCPARPETHLVARPVHSPASWLAASAQEMVGTGLRGLHDSPAERARRPTLTPA